MGSFNETCALSGHAITDGTPVRVLFLTKRSGKYERGVYHNDQWVARTPPIKGKYDDYGRAKFEENGITQVIAECFDNDVIERVVGDNECHDIAVIKGRGIHHYLKAAWKGRLLVNNGLKHVELALTKLPLDCDYLGLPVLSVMIREDVWKAFCALRHSTIFDKSKKMAKDIFEQLKEKMVRKDNGIYAWQSGHQFRQILLSSPTQIMLAEHLVAALKKDDFPDMDQLLQGCAELSRVEYIMSHLHQAWHIPMLSGQEPNWELKLRYLTKMEAIAKKELKKERDG